VTTDSAVLAYLVSEKNIDFLKLMATNSAVRTVAFNNPAGGTEGVIFIKQ